MLGSGAAGVVWQEGLAFRNLVENEIHMAGEQRRALLTQGKTGYATIAILLACIAAIVIVFFIHPYFIGLFIAASLYLHMAYFITLLIPVGRGSIRFPHEEVRSFFSTIYHTGIIPATDRFARILFDVFLINSRTLFFGVLCIFAADTLLSVLAYSTGMFTLKTTMLIFFQISAFVIFYYLVWRFEPGSIRFREGVNGLKGALATRSYPQWFIGILFAAGALIILLVILTTIILLPGITVHAFLTLIGLENLGNLFLLIGILAVSQYFILRFLHGIASAQMAEQFFASRLSLLKYAGGMEEHDLQKKSGVAQSRMTPGDSKQCAAYVLLQSRIVRLELNTLLGTFPVYLVNPDFSVIFDVKVMAVITGYIKGAASAGPERE
jgi:hypothetical protein